MQNKFKEIAESVLAQESDSEIEQSIYEVDLARGYLELFKESEKIKKRIIIDEDNFNAALQACEAKLESANAEIENYKNVNNGLAGLFKGLQSENKKLSEQLESANAELKILKDELFKRRHLESENKKLSEANTQLAEDNLLAAKNALDLINENARLRAALELIADKMPSCDCMDAPGIAREALAKHDRKDGDSNG